MMEVQVNGDSKKNQFTIYVEGSSPDGNVYAIVGKCAQLKPECKDAMVAKMKASQSYAEVLAGMEEFGIQIVLAERVGDRWIKVEDL